MTPSMKYLVDTYETLGVVLVIVWLLSLVCVVVIVVNHFFMEENSLEDLKEKSYGRFLPKAITICLVTTMLMIFLPSKEVIRYIVTGG